MPEFYIVAAALTLLAGLFVAFPVMQRRSDRVSRRATNVELFRERQQELDADLDRGEIDRAEHERLTTELQRRVLEEGEAAGTDTTPSSRIGWVPALSLVVVMALMTAALYHHTGYRPDWQITQSLQSARAKVAAGESADAERRDLLRRIEARLEQRPERPFYRLLKGNLQLELQRFAEAVETFDTLMAQMPEDPSVMARAVEARYLANNRRLDADSRALAERVLQQDPNNARILGLLGISSFETGRYRDAIDYWQRLLTQIGPNTPNGRMIARGIERARGMLGESPSAEATAAETNAPQLEVDVKLGDGIDADESASLFVYARAANGPRMPLAVQRLTVADLPARVTLNDSMAMAPGMKLSSVEAVEVVARISSRGIANRGSGDIEGTRGPIQLDATSDPVAVVIDQVVP